MSAIHKEDSLAQGFQQHSIGRYSNLDITKGLVIAHVPLGLRAVPPLGWAVNVQTVVRGAMGRVVFDFGHHLIGLIVPKFKRAIAARRSVFLAAGAESVAASWGNLLAVELVDGDFYVLVGCWCLSGCVSRKVIGISGRVTTYCLSRRSRICPIRVGRCGGSAPCRSCS